jgi:hypothetical protein
MLFELSGSRPAPVFSARSETTMTLAYRPTLRSLLTAALAAALLAGCGDSMPVGFKPPLATLTGTIAVTLPPPAGAEVRVALLWATNTDSWADKSIKHFVAQDVAVTGVTWPAQFQLAITDLPPDNAIEFGAAGGQVIAYRDLNHNGQLDFTPPDAEHFVDEVVAYDTGLVIWYFDPSTGFTPGFSTSQGSIDTPITLTEQPLASSCHLLEWELSSSDGPAGPGPWGPNAGVTHMNYCPGSPVQLTADGTGTELTDHDGHLPAETTELYCQSDDGFYEARWTPETTSAFVLETCGAVIRTCNGLRDGSATPPPAWPCPCDPSLYTCGAP